MTKQRAALVNMNNFIYRLYPDKVLSADDDPDFLHI